MYEDQIQKHDNVLYKRDFFSEYTLRNTQAVIIIKVTYCVCEEVRLPRREKNSSSLWIFDTSSLLAGRWIISGYICPEKTTRDRYRRTGCGTTVCIVSMNILIAAGKTFAEYKRSFPLRVPCILCVYLCRGTCSVHVGKLI